MDKAASSESSGKSKINLARTDYLGRLTGEELTRGSPLHNSEHLRDQFVAQKRSVLEKDRHMSGFAPKMSRKYSSLA